MNTKVKETTKWLEKVAKMRQSDVEAKRQTWKNAFLANAFTAAYQKVNRGMVAAFKLYKYDLNSQRTRAFVEKKMTFSPELYDEAIRPSLTTSVTNQVEKPVVQNEKPKQTSPQLKESTPSFSIPERSRDFSRPFDYFSGVFSVSTEQTQQAQKFKVSREINRSISNIVEAAREFSAVLRYEKLEQEEIFSKQVGNEKNELNR